MQLQPLRETWGEEMLSEEEVYKRIIKIQQLMNDLGEVDVLLAHLRTLNWMLQGDDGSHKEKEQ